MQKTIKIWITWAPSSGKTTLINYIRDNIDALLDNIPSIEEVLVNREIAREIIEKKIHSWLTLDEVYEDSHTLQKDILEENVRLYKESDEINWIVFFDTTIVCDWVFQAVYSDWTFSETFEYIDKYRYDYIFLNEHTWFVESDGIRIDNVEENLRIGWLIEEMYKKNWYNINYLPTFLPNWVSPDKLNKDQIDAATRKRFDYIIESLLSDGI